MKDTYISDPVKYIGADDTIYLKASIKSRMVFHTIRM